MAFDLFDNIDYRGAMYPLSFSEFMTIYGRYRYDGWNEYITYGGISLVVLTETEEQKIPILNMFVRCTRRRIIAIRELRDTC